jgi:hypothetical protein
VLYFAIRFKSVPAAAETAHTLQWQRVALLLPPSQAEATRPRLGVRGVGPRPPNKTEIRPTQATRVGCARWLTTVRAAAVKKKPPVVRVNSGGRPHEAMRQLTTPSPGVGFPSGGRGSHSRRGERGRSSPGPGLGGWAVGFLNSPSRGGPATCPQPRSLFLCVPLLEPGLFLPFS